VVARCHVAGPVLIIDVQRSKRGHKPKGKGRNRMAMRAGRIGFVSDDLENCKENE